MNISRRKLLQRGAGLAALSTISLQHALGQILESSGSSAQEVARDEDYWKEIASHFDRTDGLINLEHGYWGQMANPVKSFFQEATHMVNRQNSYYARGDYAEDLQRNVQAVADALGVSADEVALTRNASEAMQSLVRQYRDWEPGDKVLYSDIDYPSFKRLIRWLEDGRGVTVVKLTLPERSSKQMLIDTYVEAMEEHSELKAMLLTHVSNQHGLKLPVREIATAARERGVDVLCDTAQSWGLVDFRMDDLGVDYATFNLHKWIGSPVGVGALYMKRGTLSKIRPFPGDSEGRENDVASRVHLATSNFAAFISVEPALQFHYRIGARNKEERLKYLASLWREPADSMPHIQVLGPSDADSATGMGGFRLRGQTGVEENRALQRRLETEFGIFTVARDGLDSGGNIRVTPQVHSTPEDMLALVDALERLG